MENVAIKPSRHLELSPVIHHITRATRHLIFWSLMMFALLLLSVRVLLAELQHFKFEIAQEISKQVEAPVTIGRIHTYFRLFTPQLALDDVIIHSQDDVPAIHLKELRLGVSLLRLLTSGDVLASSWVTLVGAKLTVKRQSDGSIAIVGLKASGAGQPLWLLQGRQYQLLESSLTWQDELKHGKPLVFDDVNIVVANRGEHHKIHLLMNLAPAQGEYLKVLLNVTGNLFEPNALKVAGFVEGKAIHLPAWLTLDLPFIIHSGNADVKLWGEWQNAQLTSLTGDVQTHAVRMSQTHKTDFVSPNLRSRFFWQKENANWTLSIEQFLLETAKKSYPATNFTVSSSSASQFTITSPAFDVHEFASLAEFFSPLTEPAKVLAQADAKGQLTNFNLAVDTAQSLLNVQGEFTDLTIAPVKGFAGVSQLSGSISGTEQQGVLQLNTKNAQLNYPSLFRTPIAIKQLQGAIRWQQTATQWQLDSALIKANTPDLDTKSRLHVEIFKNEQPTYLDLQTAFTAKDMSKAPTYYPTSIMSKSLVDWLDTAFIGGKITKGGFLLVGNLNEFPFDKGQGVFQVLFDAKELELKFHPDWQHLTGLAGDVQFVDDRLFVHLHQGKSLNINIQQADISIPSLSKGEMVLVDGKFNATIPDTLSYLAKAPLDLAIPAINQAISTQGNTEADLKLTVPLEDYIPAKVDGVARLNNAQLTVKAIDLPVVQVTGDLKFNDLGLYSKKLAAVAFNYPIKIGIDTDKTQTSITVAGQTDIRELRKQFALPILELAEGISDYQVQLNLPTDKRTPNLNVRSKLNGITLNLPDGLGKTRNESRLLTLDFDLVEQALMPIRLDYDNKFKMAMQFDTEKNSIQSGYALMGTGSIGKLPNKGLIIEINREQLALNEWLGASVASSNLPDIQQIIVRSPSSLWKKTPLGAFDLTLKPENKHWLGDINSRFAKGKLNIPFELSKTQRIQLDMTDLDLALFKQLGQINEKSVVSNNELPLISLNSQNTRWQNVALGQLTLNTERTATGIRFDNVSLTGKLQKLTLSGEWQAGRTKAKGRLEMLKADELFKQFDINNDFTETSGNILFDVSWQGAPQQFSIAGVQGKLDLTMQEGRLLSVEPGFGRVLGVLAVAQWLKRLQLDFSDIYQDGLTYNNITGNFDLALGKLKTNNLTVDAVPAIIRLTGDTDLVKHSVNYNVKVIPKSADAIPIAGTILGKVGTLIGETLTGKNPEGFFLGTEYAVKGEWSKVQITPLHDKDGVLQKLTNFSWINQ